MITGISIAAINKFRYDDDEEWSLQMSFLSNYKLSYLFTQLLLQKFLKMFSLIVSLIITNYNIIKQEFRNACFADETLFTDQ